MASAYSAELVSTMGFDYVCVDTQHGLIGYESMLEQLRALRGGSATPIVRVHWNERGAIGKALDAGARGVIVPMVNSRAEVEEVVAATRYPPLGERSFGPIRPLVVDEPDYHRVANERIWVIPMVETIQAVENLDAIVGAEGIDAVYVGPADLALSMGLEPGTSDPPFLDALKAIVAGCQRHGVVAGIHADVGSLEGRLELGFSMVTVTNDSVALRSALGRDAKSVDRQANRESASGHY